MWSRGLLSIVLLAFIPGSISQETKAESQFSTETTQAQTCSIPDSYESIPGPKCDYALIIPYKLTSGSEAMFCVWVKCEVAVNVTVTMNYYSEQAILTVMDITDISEHYDCTSFTVPEVFKHESYYLTFSASGIGVNVINRKSVAVDVLHSTCLAQKEKPLYMHGETINIRLVCYDENLNQVTRKFTQVTFVNPAGSRINQILNPEQDHGVLTISFPTSEFSMSGYYSLEFEDETGNFEYTSVQIRTYDLPRVKFNVQCANNIAVLEKMTEINGSAEYEYGKPVPGTVVIQCCRRTPKHGRDANCFLGVPDICQELTIELDEEGNFGAALDLHEFKLPFTGYENYISCDITMKEQGTGALYPSSCYMSITNRLAILRLDRTSLGSYYNKMNILFAATLTDEKEIPLAYRSITVAIDGKHVKCLTTDENGRAECEIDTSSYYKQNITVSAIYEDNKLCYGRDYINYNNFYNNYDTSYPYDEEKLFRYYSKSGSKIRIRPLSGELPCYQVYTMKVDYLFTEEGVGKGATTASIKYFIVSKNKMVAHGESIVDLSESYSGSTVIEFYADAKFATGAQVMAFVPLGKDVISDTVRVSIGICFENKVTLEFTEEVVQPGATVTRKVTGAPGSFCGLRAKDASFNLMGLYDEFNPYSVYSRVYYPLYGYQYGGIDYRDPEPPCIDGNTEHFCNGMYMKPTSSRTDRDTSQDCEDLSVLMFTNLDTRRTKLCGEESYPYHPIYYAFSEMSGFGGARAKSLDIIRSDLRDYFGFNTTVLGSDGISYVTSIIPQTITGWESDVFCVSPEKGIGLNIEPAKTKTFQSFFVDCAFPSYAIRGEELTTNIVVANYIDKCAMVTMEVESSENYIVTPLDDTVEKCVCGQQRAFWSIKITLKKTGPVGVTIRVATSKISDTCDGPNDELEAPLSDGILKTINVDYEGIKREASYSQLISVKDSTAEVSIKVVEPQNMVPDSFRLFVNVLGDPVALAIKNFDNLLATPTGCCDQMLASMLPIIFLAKYLKATGDLDEIRSKKMLTKVALGYMDLLSCRGNSGAFRRYINDYSSNSWVTISTLRAVYYTKDLMYTDDYIISQGLIHISQKQDLLTGCLVPDGPPLIYQENYNISAQFTAFAAPILLELSANYSNAGPLLDGVNKCLSNLDFGSQDTLTQSYLANAAASLGQFEQWQIYYDIMLGKAFSDGDILYWKNDNSAPIVYYQYFPQADAGDVSITSTMLISMTKHPNPSQDLKNSMASAAKWLSSRLTGRGGCYSPQGNILLIEALTRFGLLYYTEETNAQVSVLYNGAEVFNVALNKDNRFIVHSQELSQGFGEYKFVASGTASPVVMVSTFFNTKVDKGENSAFSVGAVATAYECVGGVGRLINVKISLSYVGNRNQSSNCVVRVNILTGYYVHFQSYSFSKFPSRMEGNTALYFFDTVPSEGMEFTVSMYLINPVLSFKAASVVVEDFVTGETGAAEYYYPCN